MGRPLGGRLREVYLGPGDAFEALRPGWLAIDMSSIAPSTGRALAVRAAAGGTEMLDAPVSGGDHGRDCRHPLDHGRRHGRGF